MRIRRVRTAVCVIIISAFCVPILAGEYSSKPRSDAERPRQAKKSDNKVFSGCMTDGRDCYIFATDDKKHKYAISKEGLELGYVYKITGTVVDAPNDCGEYLQMIKAEKTSKTKDQCEINMGGVPGKP